MTETANNALKPIFRLLLKLAILRRNE